MPRKLGWEGEISGYDWGGYFDSTTIFPDPSTLELPHHFLGGPATGSLPDLPTFRELVHEDIPFAADLDLPNVFTDVNTFPGIRLGTTGVVATDYTLRVTDFEVLVDASLANITITLPSAIGDGQLYHIKRIDNSSNTVTIAPQVGDVIDSNVNAVLNNQWDGILLLDAQINQWDNVNTISSSALPSNVALRDAYNQFTDLNTFTGVQFASRTVTSDYSLTPLDFETLVDATAGDVTISLPAALGTGQTYHVKKIDTTANIVTVQTQGSDLIDDSVSVSLGSQWSDALLLDGAIGYWDNIGGVLDIEDLTDIARLSLPNVFVDVNTFTGLRVGVNLVSSDYTITYTDYEVWVDASLGAITITLPVAQGNGQIYRIKKSDSTPNSVTIVPQGSDLIDGDVNATLNNQWDGLIVLDVAINQWDNLDRATSSSLPPNVALKDVYNQFTDLNTFTGVQLSTRTVTSDYTLTPLDFEVLVDASGAPVTVTLPASTGSGQLYRIKKIDDTSNIVTVAAVGSDLIDGSVSLNFADQWADCQLIDAAVGYWDNTGSAATGGGGSADFGVNGRVRDLFPIHGFAFDVLDVDNVTWIEQVRYTEPGGGGPPAVGSPPAFWRSNIVDLTTLKAFTTVLLHVGTRLDCPYGAASDVSGPLASYILKTGAASGGDPGQVPPDDYDSGTNDKHWEQML